VRNDRLTAIVQQKDSPFQSAMRAMTSCLFGDDHPYGHVVLGNEDGVKRATRDELAGFYRTAFSPANAALVLAGDLSEPEARRLAARAFGQWQGTGKQPAVPGTGHPIPERVVIVDMPGSPQTALVAAQMGVARSDPDYEKLNVMNQVLGGLFGSRVNMNLREKHGYSYGAFSFMRDNRGVGPLIVGSMVRADVTGPALGELMKEVRGMREKAVTQDELRTACESIARTLPAMFQTSESTVGTVANLYLFDQPPDYYQRLPERLAGLTAAEVFEATQRHLSPESMKLIAVGDRKLIDPQIRKLGLGPITYRTNDAKPFAPAP
jgi:zinc protease